MNVILWDDLVSGKVKSIAPCCGAIGGFDGVHKGHQALLSHILDRARSTTEIPTIITFRIPPRSVKDGSSYVGSISTIAQRLKKFESAGIQQVLLIDFSAQFGTLSGENFIKILCESVGITYLAAGSDFKCGYRGGTGIADLVRLSEQYRFVLDIVPPVFDNGQRISSSLIRDMIVSGDFAAAQRLIGCPYSLDLLNILSRRQQCGFSVPLDQIRQVLPSAGRYTVLGSVATGNQIPGIAFISSNVLRCKFSVCMADVSTLIFTGYFE